MAQRFTIWIGSTASLIVHTVCFTAAFGVGFFGLLPWDTVLLVLTTAVSLEAIYLAIFIQMTMNAQVASLKEVEEDIDEIQKDIDAIEEDVDEIQEDDVKDAQRDLTHQRMLVTVSRDLQKLLEDIEKMKKQTDASKKM